MTSIRNAPLILIGLGGVGRAFVRQILATRPRLADIYRLRLQVVAVCDHTGAVLESASLGDDTLRAIEIAKGQKTPLNETPFGYYQDDLPAILDIAGRPGTVVVDCSAGPGPIPALLAAHESGYGIVLANKVPLASELSVFRRLASGARLRHEATVGAGLPTIHALQALLDSGDQVLSIAGTFSGTLGYLMTALQNGTPYAQAVREAHRLGYTEPDPRDDLSGVDVARKALILARMLGWNLELSDITLESLYPDSMAARSVPDFLAGLDVLNAEYAERAAAAATAGQTLRYTVDIRDGRCRVGMQAVLLDSPLGRLRGTDNLAAYTTTRYNPNPMVIQGRGAGVEATAAAVLTDTISLARTL